MNTVGWVLAWASLVYVLLGLFMLVRLIKMGPRGVAIWRTLRPPARRRPRHSLETTRPRRSGDHRRR